MKNNNNRLRTAAELGISRMSLYKKLHKYGLMEAM
jgi:DNA-binding protein Fis